ncbi:MAG: hypothetical protein CSA23_01325, partial [Deltaproteobacteria bacterium]
MKAKFTMLFLTVAVIFVYPGVFPAATYDRERPDGVPVVSQLQQVNCGIRSLAYLMEIQGHPSAAAKVREMLPASLMGSSIRDLAEISQDVGIPLAAYGRGSESIETIALPVIVYMNPGSNSSTGHFMVLESVRENRVRVYDTQKNRYVFFSPEGFDKSWSGFFLTRPIESNASFQKLSKMESGRHYGGGHGIPQLGSGKGSLGGSGDGFSGSSSNGSPGGGGGFPGGGDGGGSGSDGCGFPTWTVNPLNFNLVVTDSPLWYKPAIGPVISCRLTYNSRADIAGGEPFGRKWQFRYGSYLDENATTGEVTVTMGDGRIDKYTSNGAGGYNRPYAIDNRLTKIAANHFEVRKPFDFVYVYQIPAGSGLTKPHLVEMRSARGQSVTMAYNASGQLFRITDASGLDTFLTYTGGKVTRITDPFGRHADFEYTGDDLTRITDMGGIWARMTYDENANLTSIENDRGITGFLIEEGGNPNRDYPPPGDENMGAHKRITITDPLGNRQEYFYDGTIGCGWYVSSRDYVEYVNKTTNNGADFVPKTTYYYETTVRGPREEIHTIVFPEGRQVTAAHDYNTGQVLSLSDSYGNTTEYTYNDKGRITSITPEIGAVTTLVYDPANDVDLTEINRAGLGSVTMTYNAYHEVTSIEDMVGKRTDPITYNANGQITSLTQIHDDHNILTQYAYHPAGQPGAHRLSRVTRAGQTIARYTYDTIGRLQTATDAAGITLTYSWDGLNRITQVLYPDGRTVDHSCSSCCPRLVDSTTDRAGRTTTYTYDALQRLVQLVNHEGGVSKFEYDPNGNTTAFTNPAGNRTSFEYDRENRLSKRIWPDGREETYAYDVEGRLI